MFVCVIDSPMSGQEHGSTRQTPPDHQVNEEVTGVLSEGLDVFDLQLQSDCANVPGSFINGLHANGVGVGLSPSPTSAFSAAMFSSVATAAHGLASTMSNPQTTRCMVRDVAQVILRYISAHGEPQPENLSDDYQRQLILQFVDELQRLNGAPPTGVTSGGDGRCTIDKEVVLSLRNGKDGVPPPGSDVARPHHPHHQHSHPHSHSLSLSGYCVAAGAGGAGGGGSPRFATQQLLWGTPPSVTNTLHSGRTAGNSNMNSIARSAGGVAQCFSLAGLMTNVQQQTNVTSTLVSKRLGGGDVLRPRPQHPRSGCRGPVASRRATAGTQKVLRSASSAFSEFSAGETGEISSSMSRTTVATSKLAK